MRALVRVHAAVVQSNSGLGVVDAVVLLVALALTCLLGAVAFRAVARSRLKTPGAPTSRFTLMKGAGWLQTGAIILTALAAVLLLWTLVLRVVQLD